MVLSWMLFWKINEVLNIYLMHLQLFNVEWENKNK